MPVLAAGFVEEIASMKEQTLAVGRRVPEVANGKRRESGNVKVVVGGHCESLPSKEGRFANAGVGLHLVLV